MIKLFILLQLFSAPASEEAWDLLARDHQSAQARLHYSDILKEDPADQLAWIGWFLTFSGQGPTVELHNACQKVLKETPPGSPATEFVLIWMQAHRNYFAGFEESISNSLLQPLPADQTVGTFAILKANYLMRLAKTRGDEQLYSRAQNEGRTINRWLFSKRFGQYPIPDFYKEELKPEWSETSLVNSQNGTVVPPPSNRGPGILFATSRIENPSDQTVHLRLFSYQNIAIYLDGKLLLEHLRRENMGSVIQQVALQLPKGVHELVIRSTQTQKTNGHFQIQMAAQQSLKFLKPEIPKREIGSGAWKTQPIATGLQAYLQAPTTRLPHRGLAQFVEALLHLKQRDLEPAVALMENLMQLYPDSQLLGGQLIKLYLDGVSFLPQERQIGRAYKLLEHLAEVPENLYPENQLLLATLLIKAKQTKEALFFLEDLIRKQPTYCEALEVLLSLANREDLPDIKVHTLDLIAAMGHDHRWAQEQLLNQARRDNNLESELEHLQNLSELEPWGQFRADYYEKTREFHQAIETLKDQRQFFPDHSYYPFAISTMYRQLGDTETQYKWLEETLNMEPTHELALVAITNLDLYEGRRERALERMTTYLDLVPHDSTIRQMFSHLQGRTYFEPYRVNTAEVIREASKKPKSEGADSELLLDQMMVRLFPDGSQMRYTHLVTRVLTKKGVDNESEIQLPGNCEVLELRTIKQDGSVFYPEDLENKSTLSLSSVSVGDFIDEEHIEYLPPSYYDRDGLDGAMSFVFQGVDRIYHHSEIVLIYPANLIKEPVFVQRGFPEGPERVEKDGLIYLRLLKSDVPPLVPEPAMPNPAKIMPRVSFHYQTEWEEIRDFFYNAIGSNMRLTQALIDQAKAWAKEFPEPIERASFIYHHVMNRIEPSGNFYQNVNLTWENQAGNATLLLAALYKAAGLDASVAFTRTLDYEKLILDAPYPELFFRALLQVKLKDRTIWLDANQKHLPFGYFSPDFDGAKVVILDLDQAPVTRLPVRVNPFEPVEALYRISILDNGNLDGWGEERFEGMLAARLTPYYSQLSEVERNKQVEAGVNDNFPNSRVIDVVLPETDQDGKFSLSYSFEATGFAKVTPTGIEVGYPLPKSPLRDHYAGLPVRTFPIEIERPIENRATLDLSLPKGYSWETEDRTTELVSDYGSYKLKILKLDATTLRLERVYQLPTQQIPPEAYPKFRAFCQDILDAEQTALEARKE